MIRIAAPTHTTIVWDIETGPLDRDYLLTNCEPFDPLAVKLPDPPGEFDAAAVKYGNTKDEAKRAAKLEEARAAHSKAAADYPALCEQKLTEARAAHESKIMDRAALSAETGRVLTIGCFLPGDDEYLIPADDELTIIRSFWLMFASTPNARWVGFNTDNFDLPFMVRRSWLLGIPVPPEIVMDRGRRYWHPSFVDLLARWRLGVYQDSISLNRLGKYLGVGSKNGNGKDFAGLWRDDRTAAITYLKNDLELTYQCARRMSVC